MQNSSRVVAAVLTVLASPAQAITVSKAGATARQAGASLKPRLSVMANARRVVRPVQPAKVLCSVEKNAAEAKIAGITARMQGAFGKLGLDRGFSCGGGHCEPSDVIEEMLRKGEIQRDELPEGLIELIELLRHDGTANKIMPPHQGLEYVDWGSNDASRNISGAPEQQFEQAQM